MAVKNISWKRLAKKSLGLSYAELTRAADEVLKTALIERRNTVTEKDVGVALEKGAKLSHG